MISSKKNKTHKNQMIPIRSTSNLLKHKYLKTSTHFH